MARLAVMKGAAETRFDEEFLGQIHVQVKPHWPGWSCRRDWLSRPHAGCTSAPPQKSCGHAERIVEQFAMMSALPFSGLTGSCALTPRRIS